MDLFTTGEAAKVWGMSEQNVNKLIKAKKIKYELQETSSGRYLFTGKEIRRYFKANVYKKAIIILITNVKGGTGKTFYTYMLSLALKHLGFNVLLIDLDDQGNLSQQMLRKIPGPEEKMILEIFNGDVIETKEEERGRIVIDKDKTVENIMGLVRKTEFDIDIIPCNLRFSTELRKNDMDTYLNLGKCLNLIRDKYDFIIIDTPPTVSIQNEAAIIAADFITPVINPEKWAILGIEWLKKKSESVFEESSVNDGKMVGCLYNRVKEREAVTKEIIEQIGPELGGIKIYENKIPESAAYNQAIALREDPFLWENKKKIKYRRALMKLITEVMHDISRRIKRK